MSILLAALLGLVQGVTEFLPVSSSGHLSIIQNIFNVDYVETDHLLFDVLLHIGTVISVIFAYKKELKIMLTDCADVLTGKTAATEDGGRLRPTVRDLILILTATVPLLFVLPFSGRIEELFYNTPFISFALIITGCLLFACGKLTEGRKNFRTATVVDAFLVGISQAIAVIPGLSRSASTITVGIACGFKKSYAVQFSFLLSIPAVLGSAFITLIKALANGFEWANLPAYIIGMAVSTVAGFFSIQLLRKNIKMTNFNSFAYYCWGIAVISLILSFIF